MKIQRIGPPAGRWRHQRVVLDGGLTVRLRPEDVSALALDAGMDVDEALLGILRARGEVVRATETALRLLTLRLRSRREIEDGLRRRGLAGDVVRAVVEDLAAEGFLDDARFARAWVQARFALRPSGAVRLRRELRQKGVDPEVIEQVLREAFSESDEHALALEVARARARRYRGEAPEVAYRRLAGVLHRRGFSSATIMRTLREVLGSAVPAVEPW